MSTEKLQASCPRNQMREEEILAGGLRGEINMASAMLRSTADRGVRSLILDIVHRNNGISLSDLQDALEDYIPAETLEWKTFEMTENLFLMEQDGQLHLRSESLTRNRRR